MFNVIYLDDTSSKYGLIQTKITLGGQRLQQETQLEYLGSIISEIWFNSEILVNLASTISRMAKLSSWTKPSGPRPRSYSYLRALVLLNSLYECKSWTYTADLEKHHGIGNEMLRGLFWIFYRNYIPNEKVRNRIRQHIRD